MGATNKQLQLAWILSILICILTERVTAYTELLKCVHNSYDASRCPFERSEDFDMLANIRVLNFDQFRNSSHSSVKIVDDTLNSTILSTTYLRRDLQLLKIKDRMRYDGYSDILEYCPDYFRLSDDYWPWVQVLDISDNKFVKIAANSFTETSKCLEYLILTNNKIEEIEDLGLSSLIVLRYLDLSGNRLTVFDFNLIEDSPIEHLNLSSNYLSSITNYQVENKLITLNLSDNLLITFELCQMQQLVSLDLSHNKLINFNIGSTNFSTLAAENLIELDLSHNNLKLISGMFNGLISLDSLNLQGNHLMILPINTFEGLPNLKNLELSQNYIQLQFGTFWRVDKLQKLDISSNKLKEIQFGKLMDLVNLRELIIDNNNISDLNFAANLRLHLPWLYVISLGQNPWQCTVLEQLILRLRQTDIRTKVKFELKEGDFKSAINGIACHEDGASKSSTLFESIERIEKSSETEKSIKSTATKVLTAIVPQNEMGSVGQFEQAVKEFLNIKTDYVKPIQNSGISIFQTFFLMPKITIVSVLLSIYPGW